MNIIHISDPHFTASGHTLDATTDPLLHDAQDSHQKANALATWIVANHASLDANVVVLTGDLTDSGDEEDYAIALEFLRTLRAAGITVFVTPGNHDYCKEGNLLFADLCRWLRVPLDQVRVPVPRPPLMIPWPTPILEAPPWIRDPVLGTVVAPLVKAAAEALLPRSYQAPAGLADYIAKEIVAFMKNCDSNATRRERFIGKVTGYTTYPHVVSLPGATLVLLDSMQGQLDEPSPVWRFAEGNLGNPQRQALDAILATLQPDRGRRPVVVALHHSPFFDAATGKLVDAAALLEILRGRVDGLLFGHTGPAQTSYADEARRYGIRVANSENLEKMSEGYPVSVLRLATCELDLYNTAPAAPPAPPAPSGSSSTHHGPHGTPWRPGTPVTC